MTKILTLLLLTLASTAFSQVIPAGDNSFNGLLVNEAGLSYNNTYVMDLSNYDASKVSAQVLYGSTTFSASTFTDGAQSTGSITISSFSAITGNTLTIGSLVLLGGTSFATITSNNATATALAAAIQGAGLGLTASASGAVVYATSTINGASFNYSVVSSTPAAMTVSAGAMTGGVTPSFALNGSAISITGHGYTLGLPLLYTANSASIGGLTNQTTYYAIPVGTNFVELATTSARAVAIQPLVFTSTTTQLTAHAPAFSVPAITGTPTFTWQASNDDVNWATTLTTGTVTVGAYTSGNADGLFDFGVFNFRWLRLNVVAPTQGGLFLQVPVTLKQDGIGRF